MARRTLLLLDWHFAARLPPFTLRPRNKYTLLYCSHLPAITPLIEMPAGGAAHGVHDARAADLPDNAKCGEHGADLRAGRPTSEQVVAGRQRLSGQACGCAGGCGRVVGGAGVGMWVWVWVGGWECAARARK